MWRGNPHPDQRWMVQMARNVTMAEWGFLSWGQYLIHDRDGEYCPAFQQIITAAGEAGTVATSVPESQRLRGTVGEIRQGRVPLEARFV